MHIFFWWKIELQKKDFRDEKWNERKKWRKVEIGLNFLNFFGMPVQVFLFFPLLKNEEFENIEVPKYFSLCFIFFHIFHSRIKIIWNISYFLFTPFRTFCNPNGIFNKYWIAWEKKWVWSFLRVVELKGYVWFPKKLKENIKERK